jgi:hypothetical protein
MIDVLCDSGVFDEAHLGNGKTVEFYYSLQFQSHLSWNTLFNINSTIDVYSSDTRQPFNQQQVSRSIITASFTSIRCN